MGLRAHARNEGCAAENGGAGGAGACRLVGLSICVCLREPSQPYARACLRSTQSLLWLAGVFSLQGWGRWLCGVVWCSAPCSPLRTPHLVSSRVCGRVPGPGPQRSTGYGVVALRSSTIEGSRQQWGAWNLLARLWCACVCGTCVQCLWTAG